MLVLLFHYFQGDDESILLNYSHCQCKWAHPPAQHQVWHADDDEDEEAFDSIPCDDDDPYGSEQEMVELHDEICNLLLERSLQDEKFTEYVHAIVSAIQWFMALIGSLLNVCNNIGRCTHLLTPSCLSWAMLLIHPGRRPFIRNVCGKNCSQCTYNIPVSSVLHNSLGSLSINPHSIFLHQLIMIHTYTLLVITLIHHFIDEHFDWAIVEAGISMVKSTWGQ